MHGGGPGGEEISVEVGEGGDVENLHMEAVNGPECIQQDFKLIMELYWQKLEPLRDRHDVVNRGDSSD